MKILGMNGKKDIAIFTAKEIENKAKEVVNKLINMPAGEWILNKAKGGLKHCLENPLPYKLFRWNELSDFNLESVGCEITEEQYMDRIEQLPPIHFKYDIYEGYIVNECITSNIYEHIFKHDDKYYCVITECLNPSGVII